MTGLMLGLGLHPLRLSGATDGGAPTPFLAAVSADGWTASLADPAEFPAERLRVTRAGFDAAGAATTVAQDIALTRRLRLPYPNQGSFTEGTVVLSDFVHAGDTIAGVPNGSTLAAPLPVPLWLTHDLDETDDAGQITLRLTLAHAYARHGRPVAAVRFIVSDGTATVEALVTAMSVLGYPKSGLSVPHFAAALDLSGLAAGAVTADAIIYPWVGAAYRLSADGPAYPSFATSAISVLNRPASYGRAYAYVDGLGAGTPAVSTDPAVAAAAPHASVPAAAAALQAFNLAQFGRDALSGGVIRLAPGTHVLGNWSARAHGTFGCIVEAADPAQKSVTILTDAAAATANVTPDIVKFRNLVMRRSGAGSYIFLDNTGGLARQCVIENVTFSANGTSVYHAWIYRLGRLWLIDCDGDNVGQSSSQGVVTHGVTVLGCTGAGFNSAWVNHIAGSRSPGSPRISGSFIGFNHMTGTNTASALVDANFTMDARGCALVGNVIEGTGGGPSPLVSILADNSTNGCQNVIVMANTMVGERLNLLYSDLAAATARKQGHFRGNVVLKYNCKTDIFAASGAAIGNWPAAHQVGYGWNAVLRGANDGSSGAGTGHWIGEVLAEGTVCGSTSGPLAADFAADASYTGTGAGGGDYTPGAGHALPALPPDAVAYAFDQRARPVPLDGSALPGALQRPG